MPARSVPTTRNDALAFTELKDTAMSTRTASCACGQLQITCQGEPRKVSLCHCLECQKRTGSTYGIGAFYPRGDVATTGRTSTYLRSSESGYKVVHRFCADCGSTVFWEPERMPDLIAVGVGSFADPGFPPPSQSVWKERRHLWVKDLTYDNDPD